MTLKKVCNKTVENTKKIGERQGLFLRGVIYGIPVEEDLEEVRKNIKGGKVIGIKRLQAKREGVRVDSLSVLLDFQEKVLPENVKVGFLSYKVRAYVPPPLRCYKCQRYGHIAAGCKGKQACGKCGGEHEYGKCIEGTALKCVNCGGAHSVTYGGCEVRKKAEEVQKMRVSRDISYAEAARVVQGKGTGESEKRGKESPRREQVRVQEAEKVEDKKVDENILVVSKKRFVYFMVEVINCSAQAERRSEKIEVVVRCAAKYLGIQGLSGKDVQLELERKEVGSKEAGSQE